MISRFKGGKSFQSIVLLPTSFNFMSIMRRALKALSDRPIAQAIVLTVVSTDASLDPSFAIVG
ncbi:uncharacterized protein G2W53_018443 [Senna tora]|uniref:Uncharacterized protein n=1 Tax=Senna tora TaxID=362788 RepID=A0A834U0J7_9FABA|nr:uncharacterized protein G2W53_018443 [Senna tora]